jgi:hypothetical protein
MGVNGLWEVLKPSAKSVPLTVLSLEAFERRNRVTTDGTAPLEDDAGARDNGYDGRMLRVGVDAR